MGWMKQCQAAGIESSHSDLGVGGGMPIEVREFLQWRAAVLPAQLLDVETPQSAQSANQGTRGAAAGGGRGVWPSLAQSSQG